MCQHIWKTRQWPQDWKRSGFIPIPKKGNAKECSDYHTITLISHASKIMLKIFQTRFQQYMNQEFPNIQAGFRRGRVTRDQITNICWIIGKARELKKKKSTSASLTMIKPLTVWITTNCGKFLKEIGIPDQLTYLLRNLYARQEATVRNGHGTRERFKIGKGVLQGCMLCHPAY